MIKQTCSLFGLLLFAGCAAVTDLPQPDPQLPAHWPMTTAVVSETAATALPNEPDAGTRSATATPASAGPIGASDWRRFFDDPALQHLIASALAHNRDLRIAVARVAEARALAGLAAAERLPAVDVGVQQQAARVPGDLMPSGRPAVTRRYDVNLGLVAYELDFWGRVARLDEAARASYLASEFARAAFELSLISEVANAYYGLAELAERQRLATATLASRAATRALIAQRHAAGLAGELDLLTAEAAMQAARAELASLARQRAQSENALRLLVGRAIDAVLPAPTFAVPRITVGLPAEVLLQRPDVRAAEQRLAAAHANLDAARAAFLPKIVLTATAGTASRALSGLFAAGSGAWSFVPLLKWPLFDGDRREASLDLAVARQHIAVAEYEKTLQQAFREVADLLAAREHNLAQLAALEAAEHAQSERLARIEQRYRLGAANRLEWLDAERELFAARQAVVAARRQVAVTSIGFFKAVAGGY